MNDNGYRLEYRDGSPFVMCKRTIPPTVEHEPAKWSMYPLTLFLRDDIPPVTVWLYVAICDVCKVVYIGKSATEHMVRFYFGGDTDGDNELRTASYGK